MPTTCYRRNHQWTALTLQRSAMVKSAWHACDTQPEAHLGGVSAKLLAQGQRGGVLGVRAPNLRAGAGQGGQGSASGTPASDLWVHATQQQAVTWPCGKVIAATKGG